MAPARAGLGEIGDACACSADVDAERVPERRCGEGERGPKWPTDDDGGGGSGRGRPRARRVARRG
jgi:hypothetical protein